MGATKCFILPGLNNSGPQHWQTLWEQAYGFTRIQQKEWDKPVCQDWISAIDAAVVQCLLDQVVLIGHSLACAAIVRWAQTYGRVIKGALLVAPSDTEADTYPPGTTGFTPMPVYPLPFPSVVVASSNDFYVSSERAAYFAGCWHSDLVMAGALGHINTASGLGNWPQGHAILQTLLN